MSSSTATPPYTHQIVAGKMPSDESAPPQVSFKQGLAFSTVGTIELDGEIFSWGSSNGDGVSEEVVYFTVPASLAGVRAGLTLPVVIAPDSKVMDATGAPVSLAKFHDLLGGSGGDYPVFGWHLVCRRDSTGRLMLITAKALAQ